MSLHSVVQHPTRSARRYSQSTLQESASRTLPAHDELDEEPDIYRGGSPTTARPASPISSSTSSSSSSSNGRGRRRGTLAALVEHAISIWARRSSSSSSMTSSSSSTSSGESRTISRVLRRRRQNPNASLSTFKFDLESYAARKMALEASRRLSREFVLFLPAGLTPMPSIHARGREGSSTVQAERQRVLRTTSSRLILSQLDAALKKAARLRRPPRTRPLVPLNESFELGDSQPAKKSRSKDTGADDPNVAQRAWWLDVSSPTWDDMRALGKLLHLHPLTLDDILQQDPREKLELFPKLGYYFVSFRAVEANVQELQSMSANTDHNTAPPAESTAVQGVNIYLVVFREGICSFHFQDFSAHADRVRQRVLELQSTFNMSSDWICHGILDSIVDGFFPIFHQIEREVEDLDELVVSIGAQTDKELQRERGMGDVADLLRVTKGGQAIEQAVLQTAGGEQVPAENESPGSRNEKRSPHTVEFDEKALGAQQLSLSRPSVVKSVRSTMRWWDVISGCVPSPRYGKSKQLAPTRTMVMLHRMTNTRRLVTALNRLLATKQEVVTQLRKRLLHIEAGDLHWGGSGANHEVAIYMGDVQDHIIFLQQSLAHYERILGHSHPAYLSHLKVSFLQARGGTDKAILALSTLTMTVLCMQVLLGIFSMNVKLPTNVHGSVKLFVFGAVIGGTILVAVSVLGLVIFWWRRAKLRFHSRQL